MESAEKEVMEFIKLVQQLNQEQQIGLLLMVQGARLIDGKRKKQRIIRRFD